MKDCLNATILEKLTPVALLFRLGVEVCITASPLPSETVLAPLGAHGYSMWYLFVTLRLPILVTYVARDIINPFPVILVPELG
ncbi:hypothetical protein [Nostoc sp. FACHB-145]|uniref:hypothetical protein n=1 Tax=Nostoc sp. FACHB-145 TaxID=2692836 RepID=UPI0016869847|nr:hypothetical protein [Nostoc sp. FACHB-145]MBD2468757.1 hypothetical protein [Nostoc sp. FACHB-145]